METVTENQYRDLNDSETDLPVEGWFLNEDIHGAKKDVRMFPECLQGVNHDALHQTLLPHRLHQVTDLPGQTERNHLGDVKELRTTENAHG